MAEERTQRRLAAVFAADVAGYSRLMGADEEGTLARLKVLRRDLLDPKIEEHRGRIVKTTGDGLLAEFASVVDALRCAVEVQRGMAERNAGVPPEQRIDFRLGLNVGDIVIEAGDIYGDGVNVAARLEALAEPGGICVSGRVQEDARGKLDIAFEDLGDQQLKNIAWPVRVHRVQLGSEAVRVQPQPQPTNKPSIAVLPFVNMSGDPAQQYFSDGVTEDIITELSRFRSLFIIARNSSFQFRDKAIDVRRVAKELGVQYVVEGSVRKLDNRLRITAQLIEATTGIHLWSERYDRTLADVFVVQDEVVQAIVARIASQLTAVEAEKIRRKRTEHLGAYDYYLRGLEEWRSAGPESNVRSIKWFEKALALDPDYAEPLARMAITTAIQASYSDAADRFEPALAMATKAVILDPDDSWSHCALGFTKACSGRIAASEAHFKTAKQLNPNDPDQMMWSLLHPIYSGDFAKARELVTTADRLNPLPPAWYQAHRALVEYGMRDYAAAAEQIEGLGTDKHYFMRCYLAACYARLGRTQDAEREIARALETKPDLNIAELARLEPYAKPEDLNNLLEPLRSLGLPD
jgi:adenylate cyclase